MSMLAKITTLELRDYLLKPSVTQHFIDYFETHFIFSQQDEHMYVLGQFRVIGAPRRYVWLRGFEHMQTRRAGLERFYCGAVWQKYRTRANAMIEDSDRVHLLRPLGSITDLTCGLTADMVAAELTEGTISPNTGVIAVNFYQAGVGKREQLTECFKDQIVPACIREGIQVRGTFVAEMGKNDFPRLPVIQNEHALVVITAYESQASYREKRGTVARLVHETIGELLASPPETILLSPTLRSPLRWQN